MLGCSMRQLSNGFVILVDGNPGYWWGCIHGSLDIQDNFNAFTRFAVSCRLPWTCVEDWLSTCKWCESDTDQLLTWDSRYGTVRRYVPQYVVPYEYVPG